MKEFKAGQKVVIVGELQEHVSVSYPLILHLTKRHNIIFTPEGTMSPFDKEVCIQDYNEFVNSLKEKVHVKIEIPEYSYKLIDVSQPTQNQEDKKI